MEKQKGSNRRSFLRGALVAAGATSATILTAGTAIGKAGKMLQTNQLALFYTGVQKSLSDIIKLYTPDKEDS